VFTLKITGLTAQKDMESLVKVLLRVPGITSQQVSGGLKAPPFNLLSTEQKAQAESIKSMIEKFGAICEITGDASPARSGSDTQEFAKIRLKTKEKKKHGVLNFWLFILAILAAILVIENYISGTADKPKSQEKHTPPKPAEKKPAEKPAPPKSAEKSEDADKVLEKAEKQEPPKTNNDLKKDLSKNPYNTGAWKSLHENFLKEGDTVSARRAKESYDKALKTQMVLSSLAKAFGNEARVEITEDAVHYRTSKDLTDSEFYHEAEKLRLSVSTRFPGKDLVLENYNSSNQVQSVRLKAIYSNTAPNTDAE